MSYERILLQHMLELYSPTDREEAVCGYLVDVFREHGLPAKRDAAGNFVGSVGNGPREVVLMGHIDTVPGEIEVRERDGLLYGRGAVDAKGPMSTFASAALRLASQRTLRNLKLWIVGAVGEEGDSRGARYAAGCFRPDYLVIGEPSGWDSVVLGYKGSLRLHYELVRTSSHTAGRDETAPAVAVRFWQQLNQLAESMNEGKKLFDQVSPALRTINSSSDGLRDRVEMDIGIRLPLDCSPHEIESRLGEIAEGAKVQVSYGDPAVRGSKNTLLTRSFVEAIRASGAKPRYKVKTGTSDMNVVAPVWNCPMLAYGPGDSSLDHTPDEHIALQEYERGISVLMTALEHLDKLESERLEKAGSN